MRAFLLKSREITLAQALRVSVLIVVCLAVLLLVYAFRTGLSFDRVRFVNESAIALLDVLKVLLGVWLVNIVWQQDKERSWRRQQARLKKNLRDEWFRRCFTLRRDLLSLLPNVTFPERDAFEDTRRRIKDSAQTLSLSADKLAHVVDDTPGEDSLEWAVRLYTTKMDVLLDRLIGRMDKGELTYRRRVDTSDEQAIKVLVEYFEEATERLGREP